MTTKTIKYYVKVDYDQYEYDCMMDRWVSNRKSLSSLSFDKYEDAELYIESYINDSNKKANFQFSIHKFWEC